MAEGAYLKNFQDKNEIDNGYSTTSISASCFRNTLPRSLAFQGLGTHGSAPSNAYTTPLCLERPSQGSYYHTTSPIVSSMFESALVPENLLENSCAYALDRGNGQYTRLVPADCLPSMDGLPKMQRPMGLIILPLPKLGDPFAAVVDRHLIQGLSAIGEDRPTSKSRQPADLVQTTIDNTISALPERGMAGPQRKVKVYCDKWLHHGTCAFTQQGCRYKHEMPLDKETQLQVGLFNGLPYWYCRQQGLEPGSHSSLKANGNGTSPRCGRRRHESVAPWRSHDRNSSVGSNVSAPMPGYVKSMFARLETNRVGTVSPFPPTAPASL